MEYSKLTKEQQYFHQVIEEEKKNLLRYYVKNINIVIPTDHEYLSYDKCIEKSIKQNYNYKFLVLDTKEHLSEKVLSDIVNLYIYSLSLENICENLEINYNKNMLKSKKDCNDLFDINNNLVKNNKTLMKKLEQKHNYLNILLFTNLFLLFYMIFGIDNLFLHINYFYYAISEIINLSSQVFYWIYINCCNFDYSFLQYNFEGITICLILISIFLFIFIKYKQE